MTNKEKEITSPIIAFEPRTSGIGSDCSTNWGTTTAQIYQFFFKKWANPGLLFLSFQHVTIQILIAKSIDGVLGIQTQSGRMEGTDESTELRRHPTNIPILGRSCRHCFLDRVLKVVVIGNDDWR